MVFNAVLPGSGIPYVTYGEAKKWTLDEHGRKNKYGNGNFWGMVVFGERLCCCATWSRTPTTRRLTGPLARRNGRRAAQPFQYGKYTAGGLAGLITRS